jgi:hypothetical protein
MRNRVALRVVLALLVALAIGAGAVSMFTPVEAKGPCRCPLVYAPVQCDHGRVYPNPCEAECHNAQDCVPLPL